MIRWLIAIALFLPSELAIAQYGSCGLMPLAPLPPVGCRALQPICLCDPSGRYCHWEFQCIR